MGDGEMTRLTVNWRTAFFNELISREAFYGAYSALQERAEYKNAHAAEFIQDLVASGSKFRVHQDSIVFIGDIPQPGMVARNATAFVHRDAHFMVNVQGYWVGRDNMLSNATAAYQQAVLDALRDARDSAQEMYQGLGDEEHRWLERYYGENLPRLQHIKSDVDPENMFSFHKSIPPVSDCDVGHVRACGTGAKAGLDLKEDRCASALKSKCLSHGLESALKAVKHADPECAR